MFWVFLKFGTAWWEKIPLPFLLYTHTTPRPCVLHPIYATEAAHTPRNGRAFVQESLQM